jgi:hypothetical protein
MIEDVTVRSGASRWASGPARWAALLGLAAGAWLGGCRGAADQQRSLEAEPPRPGAPAAEATSAGEHAGQPSPAAGAAPSPAASDPAAGPRVKASDLACELAPFPRSLPIAEASGAVLTTIDGAATLMVIADSGHDGDYLLVDPQSGAVRERGKLPLGGPDGKGDDLEGLAFRNGRFYALTSSGWLRAWEREGPPQAGFELVLGPTPIGAMAPAPDAMSCALARVNCGKNFEGLCLAPAGGAAGECVGMAASKQDGRLYCLVETGGKDGRDAGRLAIDPARSIAITKPDALADCNIDGETLWAGANFFDVNRVWRVEGWRSPAPPGGPSAVVIEELGAVGGGFCEGMAAAGETLFRLSDTQGSPSLVSKFRCQPPPK